MSYFTPKMESEMERHTTRLAADDKRRREVRELPDEALRSIRAEGFTPLSSSGHRRDGRRFGAAGMFRASAHDACARSSPGRSDGSSLYFATAYYGRRDAASRSGRRRAAMMIFMTRSRCRRQSLAAAISAGFVDIWLRLLFSRISQDACRQRLVSRQHAPAARRHGPLDAFRHAARLIARGPRTPATSTIFTGRSRASRTRASFIAFEGLVNAIRRARPILSIATILARALILHRHVCADDEETWLAAGQNTPHGRMPARHFGRAIAREPAGHA